MIYKTVLLEDNEVDASLMKQYLKKSSLTFDIKIAQNGKEFEECVRNYDPDLIISDFRLHQYSGMDALSYRNIHCRHIPFIIISGHIGEEKAADLIKKGASHFLMKNNAEANLAPVAERSIHEYEERKKFKKSEVASRQNRMLLEIITNQAMLPVWIRNKEGKFYFVNQQFIKLFDLDKKTMIGKNNSEIFDNETARQFDENDIRVKNKGSITFVEKVNTSEGVKYYQSNMFLLKGIPELEGAVAGWAADITDQKENEIKLRNVNETLKKYTKDLQVSSAELEQFAYVVSHDLQEPLRMIASFMKLLKEKYGDVLDEKALQYIYYAMDGAEKMKQIILDLLDFSKVGKNEDKMETVDLNELVDFVLQMNQKLIKEQNATIEVETLPTLTFYRSPLIQIFQNLIENSLKYGRKGVDPKILIQAEEKEEEWIFSVKDNGKGIDPEYCEKIFIIFQRLDKENKYGGTGMGLPVVKKIIDNLNGRIWVGSEVNKGSTFYFSIPIITVPSTVKSSNHS